MDTDSNYEDDKYNQRSFERRYRCYPVSFTDKPYLENGDKILMPQSALDYLASLHIDYPMLFELNNPSIGRVSHCGVMEFTAEEGVVFLPQWMMQNMLLQEGDIVVLKNATLPKGTFVKLQPHTRAFLDISNPRAILERTLRSFSCLTTGDTIVVAYNNKSYHINVVDVKPSGAISIIETDCEVDFAPPLDYKEPEKSKTSTASCKALAQVQGDLAKVQPSFIPFMGAGRRLNGEPAAASTPCAPKEPQPSAFSGASSVKEFFEKVQPSFMPFVGVGRRMDSKPSEPAVTSTSPDHQKLPQQMVTNGIGSTPKNTSSLHPSARLSFGSNTNKVPNPKDKNKVCACPQPQREEESNFKAFSGMSNSLKN